jgi:DNA-binding NtrC family response regulator
MPDSALHMLLVEPETLLRRTVSLTARTLGLGQVHEAASIDAARRMLEQRRFDGAVIAVDCVEHAGQHRYDMTLVEQVRQGLTLSAAGIPIAIMADQATPELVQELQDRQICRVILKPFRAKVLLETIAGFSKQPGSGAAGVRQ